MQSLSLPAFGSSDREANPALNVVIAYEDLETGKRAMKTYESMVHQLGDQCLFTNQMWKFDVLAVPKLKEIAAKDAASAEIVIVSAHDGNELPKEVKAWIEMWLSYKSGASALVALFDGGTAENPIRAYLTEVARRGKMEFFCEPGAWPASGNTRSVNTFTQPLNEKTFSFLANATPEAPSFSHWGINE